jgi:hypothetical protein
MMHLNRTFLKLMIFVAGAVSFLPAVYAQNAPRFVLELEAGPVWQSRNDVQVPNTAEGTRFSLADLAGNGPWPAIRLPTCPIQI